MQRHLRAGEVEANAIPSSASRLVHMDNACKYDHRSPIRKRGATPAGGLPSTARRPDDDDDAKGNLPTLPVYRWGPFRAFLAERFGLPTRRVALHSQHHSPSPSQKSERAQRANPRKKKKRKRKKVPLGGALRKTHSHVQITGTNSHDVEVLVVVVVVGGSGGGGQAKNDRRAEEGSKHWREGETGRQKLRPVVRLHGSAGVQRHGGRGVLQAGDVP